MNEYQNDWTWIEDGLPDPLESCLITVIDTFDGSRLVYGAMMKPNDSKWYMDDESGEIVPPGFQIISWRYMIEPDRRELLEEK